MEMDSEGNVFLNDRNGTPMGKKPGSSLYIDQVFWPYSGLDAIPETFKDEDLARFMWAQAPQVPWHLNIWDDEQFKIFCDGIKKITSTWTAIHRNNKTGTMILV